MRTSVWIILIIGLLITNNLLLLNLLGYFDPPANNFDEAQMDSIEAPETESISPDRTPLEPAITEMKPPEQETLYTEVDEDFAERFMAFASTEEFQQIFDDYQYSAQQRYEDREKELSQLSTQELIDGYFETDSKIEKMNFLSKLRENGLQHISSPSLHSIYQDTNAESWHRGEVLSELIKRGDPTGIQWAKSIMTGSDSEMEKYMYNMASSLYDREPEFIVDLVGTLTWDELEERRLMFSGILDKPRVAEAFLARNIDDMLRPDLRVDRFYLSQQADVDLSSEQEGRVVRLFEHDVKANRTLAISISRNIESSEVLRDAYERLTRPEERAWFLRHLYRNYRYPSQRQLVESIARESDDPDIRRIVAADLPSSG